MYKNVVNTLTLIINRRHSKNCLSNTPNNKCVTVAVDRAYECGLIDFCDHHFYLKNQNQIFKMPNYKLSDNVYRRSLVNKIYLYYVMLKKFNKILIMILKSHFLKI